MYFIHSKYYPWEYGKVNVMLKSILQRSVSPNFSFFKRNILTKCLKMFHVIDDIKELQVAATIITTTRNSIFHTNFNTIHLTISQTISFTISHTICILFLKLLFIRRFFALLWTCVEGVSFLFCSDLLFALLRSVLLSLN